MTYDDWKTETPEDEYARRHPHVRNGVYKVPVTRQMEVTLMVEVEAAGLDEAIAQAIEDSRAVPFAQWTLDQDDYDVLDVDGPPERDPDAEREDRRAYREDYDSYDDD